MECVWFGVLPCKRGCTPESYGVLVGEAVRRCTNTSPEMKNFKENKEIWILVAQTVKCLPTIRETGFNPWVRKIWRRKWQPTPVFLLGKSHGWRNLVGYSPWGHKASDTTEQLHFHFNITPKDGRTVRSKKKNNLLSATPSSIRWRVYPS